MKMSISKKIFCAAVVAVSATFFSCKTTSKELPDDLSAPQLLQLGQDAYASKRYKKAMRCYNAILERFGSNQKHYVEAKYEIAHLYRKTRKYNDAYPIFLEIIDIYDNTQIGVLPAKFRKLVDIELAKIPEEAKQAAKENMERKALEEQIKAAKERQAQEEADARAAQKAEVEELPKIAEPDENQVTGPKPEPVQSAAPEQTASESDEAAEAASPAEPETAPESQSEAASPSEPASGSEPAPQSEDAAQYSAQ